VTENQPSVLLINPPITSDQRRGPLGPVIKSLYFNSPPLGLAYIAAVLERDGIRVGLIDAAVEDLSVEQTVDRIREFAPDLVGLTSTTNFFCNAEELAHLIRARCPGVKILIGGPHVASTCETVLEDPAFDFACLGEGEYTTLELVHALNAGGDLGEIPGLAFRVDGRLVRTATRPLIENLDDLPLPARHLLPLALYVPQPNDGPYLPKAAMISSRGCPFRCTFCDHGIYGNTYRSLSSTRIVDEMQELVHRYGIRDIAFVDSLFMISAKRVNSITEEIVRRGVKIHWTCTIRANIATREILERMKAAGCWRVRVGIESGNEEVLRFIKKDVTREQVVRVTRDADDLGLHPKGFFMIGHPTETAARIRESMDFARSLPLTDITVQINTPLPGSPQWHTCREQGAILTDDLKKYSFWEPVFVPHGLTQGEIESLHRKFYRSFYLRPIVWWRHLRMLKGTDDIRRYLRGISLLISMFIKKRKRG